MCGPKFCSMQISHELRELAGGAGGAEAAASVTPDEAAAGMAAMSEEFKRRGAEVYHAPEALQ